MHAHERLRVRVRAHHLRRGDVVEDRVDRLVMPRHRDVHDPVRQVERLLSKKAKARRALLLRDAERPG